MVIQPFPDGHSCPIRRPSNGQAAALHPLSSREASESENGAGNARLAATLYICTHSWVTTCPAAVANLVALVRCLRLAGRLCVWLSASPALSLVFHLQHFISLQRAASNGGGGGTRGALALAFCCFAHTGGLADRTLVPQWRPFGMRQFSDDRPDRLLDHHHVIGCFFRGDDLGAQRRCRGPFHESRSPLHNLTERVAPASGCRSINTPKGRHRGQNEYPSQQRTVMPHVFIISHICTSM